MLSEFLASLSRVRMRSHLTDENKQTNHNPRLFLTQDSSEPLTGGVVSAQQEDKVDGSEPQIYMVPKLTMRPLPGASQKVRCPREQTLGNVART